MTDKIFSLLSNLNMKLLKSLIFIKFFAFICISFFSLFSSVLSLAVKFPLIIAISKYCALFPIFLSIRNKINFLIFSIES